MKRAPWVGLGAIAVLLATLGWSPAATYDAPQVAPDLALDFRGIDTLVVRSPGALVELHGPGTAMRLENGDDVEVTRVGTTLVVSQAQRSYPGLRIHAPAALRRIETDSGRVQAMASVGAIVVEAHGAIEWSGDARSLQLLDGGPKASCKRECRPVLKVDGGEIGTLFARTRGGSIVLDDPARIAQATLALGEEAEFTLAGLREVPTHVQVVGYDAAPPATDAPTQVAEPAEPPPRD
jgi:hypothetical protein